MEFTSAMHSVSTTRIHWEKELLALALKSGSHITVTLKTSIDSAACTNWEQALGNQQPGRSCDLWHESCQVRRAERTSVQGIVSVEVAPKLEQKTSLALFKKAEYIYLKGQKIWTNKIQNLTRQELVTMKVKQLRHNIWHKSLPVSASLFEVQFSGSCWKHQV